MKKVYVLTYSSGSYSDYSITNIGFFVSEKAASDLVAKIDEVKNFIQSQKILNSYPEETAEIKKLTRKCKSPNHDTKEYHLLVNLKRNLWSKHREFVQKEVMTLIDQTFDNSYKDAIDIYIKHVGMTGNNSDEFDYEELECME